VYPRSVVERTLPPIADIDVADPTESLFWQPVLNFPAGMSVADRRRLIDAYRQKLSKQVLPAYRRLHAYLKDEYLPQARKKPGMAALPSGDFWYAYRVRAYTGSALTPAEVHAIGLREVARLRGEGDRLMRRSSGATDLRGWFDALRAEPSSHDANPATLLAGYASVQERVHNALPLLFAGCQDPLRCGQSTARALCRRRGIPAAGRRWQTSGRVVCQHERPATARLTEPLSREALPGQHLQAARRSCALARVRNRRPGLSKAGPCTAVAWRDLGLYADQPAGVT
jgi:uncharacterized protein (DUF885 family)